MEKIVGVLECPSGHVAVMEFDARMGREYAETQLGLLDGTSPMYKFPPGPESQLGKCGVCRGPLKGRIVPDGEPIPEADPALHPIVVSPVAGGVRLSQRLDPPPGKAAPRSVVQDWVATLGLRHQGVLLAAIRGSDTARKHAPVKLLSRAYRGQLLNPHVGDLKKAKSFMEAVDADELLRRMNSVIEDHDDIPHHFLLHLTHAAEVMGYYHPDDRIRSAWNCFYISMCRKFHMHPESKVELDYRLNADEERFAAAQ